MPKVGVEVTASVVQGAQGAMWVETVILSTRFSTSIRISFVRYRTREEAEMDIFSRVIKHSLLIDQRSEQT